MSFLTSSVLAGDAIPDTSMFNSPIYQWAGNAIDKSDGTSPVDWPVSIADLSDATAVGSPTKTTQSNKQVVEYDPSNDNDAHHWSSDADIPTGSDSFSWAATVWFQSGGDHTIASFGNSSDGESQGFGLNNGKLYHFFFGGTFNGSTVSTGQFTTIGVRYDGSNRKLYLNGSGDGTDTPGSQSVKDTNHSLGYFKANNTNYCDAYVYDIVLCDAAESDQAFTDYHNDRI